MPQSVISVVLLPNSEDRQSLERLSAHVNRNARSLIQLAEHSPPYITVAQFLAPRDAADDLWQAVQGFDSMVTDLIAGSLAFVPETQASRIWVEVGFLKSARLEQLQAKVLSTEFAAKSGGHNHVGELYRPHCTLALLEGGTIPSLPLEEDAPLLRHTFTRLTLAVGLSGENFTLSEVLHAAP